MITIYQKVGALCFLLCSLLIVPQQAYAEDELNCTMCHKHRGLSRVDEDGNFRLFYINQELFNSGPHRGRRCSECHTDIDQIPHKPAEKVDCTQECHIEEPSGKKKFSHKTIAKTLSKSAHARLKSDGTLKPHQDDFPECKSCHDQPLYRPLSFYKGAAAGISKRAISRCKSCHATGDFVEKFYEHVTSRLHKTRTSKEIVKVCAKCHSDEDVRERHNLDDVVKSYKETFHGKMVELGSERTPDCIDCHVVNGESVHRIESRKVATSATYPKNLATTCRASECHEKASPQLASFQTHVTYSREKYPMQFYMLIGFKGLLAFVMYFFLLLIFFELLRRLFPRFVWNKAKRADIPGDGHD